MSTTPPAADPLPPPPAPPTPDPEPPGTPRRLRLAVLGGAVGLGLAAYLLRDVIGARGRAAVGVFCFIGLAAACSTDLRGVRWGTVVKGLLLQLALAVLILQVPVVYDVFRATGRAVEKFLEFTTEGSKFVFGPLADQAAMRGAFGPRNGFVFAFAALPTIIFVSSFFTVLYYFGVLQWVVRQMSWVMKTVMGTSGAETLSASANVFMGQTEAPLIVKPYVKGMTRSELLALMVGGMATISGGVMAVFIQLGADAVAILAASVMAAPCGLYLAKLLYPEAGTPQTLGRVRVSPEVTHRNAIDAASGGASDGLHLALNVAAMLIAFLALLAMADYLLGAAYTALRDLAAGLGLPADRIFTLDTLTLRDVFAVAFAPVAFLMGVAPADIPGMADLLGTKLVLNEFVAYVKLTDPEGYRATLDPRTYVLATYALAGFANVASIGIQIGGIGGLAPERRGDLARLGTRALLGGFLATLINACIAAVLL